MVFKPKFYLGSWKAASKAVRLSGVDRKASWGHGWGMLLLLLFSLSILSGCGRGASGSRETEVETTLFKNAQQCKREGRLEDALGLFLKLVDQWPGGATESHLEAGLIYLDYIQDPVEAIHHFRKYLQVKPQAVQTPMIRGLMDRAKLQFAAQLPADPFKLAEGRADLAGLLGTARKEAVSLRQENARLKAQLEEARLALNSAQQKMVLLGRSDASAGSVFPLPQSEGNTASEGLVSDPSRPSGAPRLYTVGAGDTLVTISKQVYGQSQRWNDIYQANRDVLSSPHALRPGQQLYIP